LNGASRSDRHYATEVVLIKANYSKVGVPTDRLREFETATVFFWKKNPLFYSMVGVPTDQSSDIKMHS
jgi:hypothetical protein